MLVRIIKDWDWPDLLRQTPQGSGEWAGIRFTEEAVTVCDFVIVCNRILQNTEVKCDPHHIWKIIQEPPVAEYRWLQKDFDQYGRIFYQDDKVKRDTISYSPPALPWHINKNYDFLKNCSPQEKSKNLSWITSNATDRKGHQQRMSFLKTARKKLDFDLWGKGFTFIKDKWDGLAGYQYSLAVENHRSNYYWTEKLADCYLSWTMPVYYGCRNILDYFPEESLILIDIHKPYEAVEMIREAIAGNYWKKNIDAIAHARKLILDQYQFFPYFTGQISRDNNSPVAGEQPTILLKALPWMYKSKGRWRKNIISFGKRGFNKLLKIYRLKNG